MTTLTEKLVTEQKPKEVFIWLLSYSHKGAKPGSRAKPLYYFASLCLSGSFFINVLNGIKERTSVRRNGSLTVPLSLSTK